MRKYSFLILVFLSVNVIPQNRIDSLVSLLESVTDTARFRVVEELCWENRYINPSEALKYGLQAMSLVKQYELYEKEPRVNNYLGIIQRNVGDHATALEYFFNAQRLAKAHNNNIDLAYALNNIGDIYNLEENYQLALEYEMESLRTFESIGDSLGISYSCHQIALVYTNLEEYSKALKYDTRAMNIREFLGNRAGVAYSLISIGQIKLRQGEYAESLESLLASVEIFTELNDNFGLAYALHGTGIYYRTIGNMESATKYLNEAMNLGKETDSPIRVRNAAQILSEIYAEQNRFKEAYQMYILYKETYDSLYHEENLVKITQLVMQNEYEQKELLQLAEIARQKQFRNYLILSFCLVMILVIVIFNRYYIKKKANIILLQKNKEIKQAQTHLVQSEKMASLGQLTAGVAHELNNPINFISTSTKPLQRNMKDLLTVMEKYDSIISENKLSGRFAEVDELKESLEFMFLVQETKNLLSGITEGAFRSAQIVKDLRTFSRMDENEFIGVNIHDGIESTLLLLSNTIKDRITIHKNYGKIPYVECLPGKLNQVFMNILTNGIQAIEGNGEISIETSSVENKARISIKDNGVGMAPEIREHIFEPFFTTRAVGKGTGLGLSISYSIIEEHHGTIEVYSEPGEGSEFIIMLPFNKTV